MEKMDIVIDTSVLIAAILNESEKEEIVGVTSGHTLVGPELIRWEIGNAFSTMFKRGRISLRVAQKALEVFADIPIRYLNVDFKEVLKLAHDNKIYAYDAYFLDCALRYKAPLISLDSQMIATARNLGIHILEIRK